MAPRTPTSGERASAARPEIPTRLLVHALVRENGTVDAGQLHAVAGTLGMSDQQIRLCVRRLVEEGRFTQDGRGRKALLRAVADASGALAPDADHVRHAYRQDAGLAPWDGTWHLFAFAVPESRRNARDALRDRLLHLGAAPLQGGLYVTANPVTDLVEAHARHLGVLSCVTFLTSTDLRVGTLTAPPALAAALWPLEDIAAGHERLAAFTRRCLDELAATRESAAHGSPEGRLTMAVELAAEFTRAMEPDPLLPPELLPRPWPGAAARRLAAECWQRLREAGPAGTAEHGDLRLFRLYHDALGTGAEG
ncbi:PaaX family transcriptional regulator C-terminal domain-containing protein [Streptomyces sp. NPDC014991]|uniref:PaaX family transcriptional regulator C-terminal domain-containing protein n=1 Tax=Streptomyces sp. NPDC014991 TaxID=3364935 RepID=UPI0037024225